MFPSHHWHEPIKTEIVAFLRNTPTDGVGFGSLFQWGRIADGHEQIGWATNFVNRQVVFDRRTDNNNRAPNITTPWSGMLTSMNYARPGVELGAVGINTGRQVTGTANHIGSFIVAPLPEPRVNNQWGDANHNLWGANGAQWNVRASAPTSAADWTYTNNNPCLALGDGWRVPQSLGNERFAQWNR